jgi:glycosyltransferase involved in cell wall biosynthesis
MSEPLPARRRPRLLVVGDAVFGTGFARVLHSILDRLAPHYEIHHLGINYYGDPHDSPWKIYPAQLGGDMYGVGRLAGLVAQVAPDLVFLLNGISVLGEYVARIRLVPQGHRTRIVAYCPVESGPVESDVLARLERIDRCVAFTQYARGEIEAALVRLRRQNPAFRFPAIDVIPHGVDAAAFPPHDADVGNIFSEGRLRTQRRLFGEAASRPLFIVLNANRNLERKRIDITIEGFARFAAGKPDDVKLHLHMALEDAGWNVVTLARRHGIGDRLILTNKTQDVTTAMVAIPSVPIDELSAIYTAAAVGLNTATSEGWGLVTHEHAATGAAQVAPRHTAFTELWDGSAMMVEPVLRLANPKVLTDAHYVAPEAVADALERLHADRDLLRAMSVAAHRVATRPEFQWDGIARRWDALFEETLGSGATAM